ncbi:uncharacterized protein [Sinocyclocheilus grahami]|uniref:uncharacterized protein n=1 Tax=Sinocyclocheilus grahami TaxID=75366 RepID=UPI0007AC7D7E|nr:PREDICTED: uncharacterized protein LOC107577817 [Sinocyclocheilus grahami]
MWLTRNSVKDLQSMEAAVEPLNEGIFSLCNICKSLFDAQVDQTTDMCSNYKQTRGHIENTERCLEKSETISKEKLGSLDECIERFTKEKGNYEQQKKEKCMANDKLNTEKNSAEELLKNAKAALEQAEKNVESAKYALRVHQDRKSTGDGLVIAGAALLALPFIGWISGSIMICEGERLINEASRAIRDAEDELEENESKVNENSKKVSNYQSRISSIQNEIEETDKVLNKIQRETEEVNQHLEVTAEFQEIVRKAVNAVSVLRGRVTVLERQTQRFVLWQPVIKAIKDVMKAAENVAGDRLLYSQGVSGLINTLREKTGELEALCNSPNNSEQDSYY